jgi:hypothetical protein
MKLIYFTLIFLFIIFFVNCDSLCRNEILSEIESPNRNLKAVIFQRDCGATTDFSYHISLIKVDKSLPNKSGNILVLDDKKIDLQKKSLLKVDWINSTELQIKYPSTSRIFLSETKAEVPISFFKSELIKIQYLIK